MDSQINVADAEACANACTTDSVCQEAILFTPSTCDLVVVGNNVFIQAVDSISFLPNATCPQA